MDMSMKARTQGGRGERGIGRRELLLVVLIAGLLGCLGFVSLRRGAQVSDRTRCEDNLKMIGAGFSMWLHDQEDKLPWQVPVAQGGSLGLGQISDHFLRLSNYIQTPAVLACPGLARQRPPTDKWALLSDQHVSYALNCHNRLVMDEPSRAPRSALSLIALDMDLEGGKPVKCSSCSGNVMEFTVGPGAPLRWSRTNHVDVGKLMRVDGTVAAVASGQPSGPNSSKDEWRQSLHIMIPK